MCPANDVNVFGELVIGGIEIARVSRSCPDRKPIALHGYAREALEWAINLNSKIGRRKVWVNHAIIASTVDSRMRRENRVSAEQIGVTENERVRAIELSYTTHRQHIHAIKAVRTRIVGEEIAPKQAVLFSVRIVDLADGLMLVIVRRNTIQQPAAWVCRSWYVFQKTECLRTNTGRIESVSDKRRRQRARRAAVAGGRSKGCEISGTHRRRRRIADRRARIRSLDLSLITAEEK